MMARYAASGQTQAVFCVAEGLPLGTFQYWWRRYRAAQPVSGGFVALELQGAALSESEVELHYGAVRLRLNGVATDYVVELVHKLAERC